jgi:tetratricopeptide (TPR) repeat protein
VSFHLLLSKYLASTPRPLVPHKLPSTDLQPSASIVRALVSLCSAGGRVDAMIFLQRQLKEPDATRCWLAIAEALASRARFADALAAAKQAFLIDQDALSDTQAQALNRIILSLWSLGRYKEALQHVQQALEKYGSALGDADKARAHSNASGLLRDLGRHEEALQHEEKALELHKSAEDPRGRAYSLFNMGCVLLCLGRNEQALLHAQDALGIRSSLPELGDGHQATAQSLNLVGDTLQALGRHEESLTYQKKALAVYQAALGDKHPDTAKSRNSAGVTLQRLGRPEEALEYHQSALTSRKSAFGDEHPDTAQSLNNVGSTLGELGRHEEALQHEQQALAIRRTAFGDAHPDTASSLNNVGATLGKLGRHEEALQHNQQALAIRRTALGDAHPDTASSLNNVGSTLGELGRHEEALQHEQQALAIRRTALGAAQLPAHLPVVSVSVELAPEQTSPPGASPEQLYFVVAAVLAGAVCLAIAEVTLRGLRLAARSEALPQGSLLGISCVFVVAVWWRSWTAGARASDHGMFYARRAAVIVYACCLLSICLQQELMRTCLLHCFDHKL